MVLILKPRHRTPVGGHVDITSEELPGNADNAEGQDKQPKRPSGIELSEDDGSGDGTSSAPGEGPNPTA